MSKGWKFCLGDTTVMVSGAIAKDGLSKITVYPHVIYDLRFNLHRFCVRNVVSESTVDVLE